MEIDSRDVTRAPSIEEKNAQCLGVPSPSKDVDLEPSQNVTPSGLRVRTPKTRNLRPFQGMITDVQRRLPYYWSDWKDAWTYRVIPATAMIFFAKYVLAEPCGLPPC